MKIYEDLFKKIEDKNDDLYMCFEDGINFSGIYEAGNYYRSYTNGDKYEIVKTRDNNNNVILTIVSYYNKELDVTFIWEKENNKYIKKDSSNSEEISEKEFIRFVVDFIFRNKY